MFERSKIEHHTKSLMACQLVLDDGRELVGHLLVSHPRGIAEELNASGGFAEFETLDRERAFLAKSSIRVARGAVQTRVEGLDKRFKDGAQLDPHAVLGIERTADRDSIRRAYHALARAYHPDRMQAIDLPAEIVDYATAMSKRINAAYSALQAPAAMAGTSTSMPSSSMAGAAKSTAGAGKATAGAARPSQDRAFSG